MQNFLKKNENIITFIFFSSLFLVGLLIYPDFGLGLDEDNSRVNGFTSLKYFFEIFFPEYIYKINNIILVGDIYNYNEQGNGVVFDLPLAFLELILDFEDIRQVYLLRHFSNFFMFFVSVFIFYKIVNNRYDSYIIGLLGAFFLVMSPRIFAESFNNTKDIFLMSLFIVNIFLGIKFLDNPSIKTAIIFSVVSALAVDVRIIVIFFPLLVCLIHLINILRMNNFKKGKLIPLFTILIFLPIFIILFWPYLWANPVTNFIEVFEKLSNFSHPIYNFYFGEYISAKSLPWHYPVVWILITTPIFYTILFLIGFWFILFRLIKRLLKIEVNDSYTDLWRGKKELNDIIFLFTFLIPMFTVIIFNSSLYDGWRHLYFIYPSFLMISLHGFYLIKNILYTKKNLLINLLAFTLILPTFYWMVSNHPFQNNYFNFLIGKNFNKKFEMDYWGISNKVALEYIANDTLVYKVNVYNLNTSDLMLSKNIINKKNREKINIIYNIENADYIVNSYRDWNGFKKPQEYSVPSGFKLLYEIKVDDIPINSIYKRK